MNKQEAYTAMQLGLFVRRVGSTVTVYYKIKNGEVHSVYLTDRDWRERKVTGWFHFPDHNEWELYEPDRSSDLFAPRS